MARIRTIKPDAFRSESLSQVPIPARWTFAGLLTYVDDEGRGRDDARLIKADLYPLDDDMTPAKVAKHVEALAGIGTICRYVVGERGFFHFVNWSHQNINRPTPSKLPECPLMIHGGLSEGSSSRARAREQGTGNREQGTGKRPDVERLCSALADKIETNGSNRPEITKAWRDSARLMLDSDGRKPAEALRLIGWCQADEFWLAHILDMPTFRRQYDKLRLAARRANGQRRPSPDGQEWMRARPIAPTHEGDPQLEVT